ncbi:MAG: sulfatase [Planctomycetes bacterium]|nr:sulfatase [Planctomycetota bacterium]
MNSVPKKTFDLRTLIVALAVLAAVVVYFQRVRGSVEALLPVVRESRIALIPRLDLAREGAGFHAGERFLTILGDEHRSIDHDGLGFPLPQTGDVTFEDLPVHAAARLDFAYGFDWIKAPEAQGATVEFIVRARVRRSGEEAELFRAASTLPAPSTSAPRIEASAPLPASFVGERVDLVFATRCDRELPELAFLPVFLSPVLVSNGIKVRVGELAQTVTVGVRDLLADYDAALEIDDEIVYRVSGPPTREQCFAVKTVQAPGGPRVEFLPLIYSELTGSFSTTEHEFRHAHGGAWPALAFCGDDTIVRYDVDVPKEGARLEFMIGQDFRTLAVGDTEYVITVDGSEVFRERLEPNRVPAHVGWHERAIDLLEYRGRRIKLGFAGRVMRRAPATIELVDLSRPLGPPQPYALEVQWPRGAFALPRILRRVTVPRRAAAKDRPSVVFVCVETWRRDAAGCYGGPDGVTPTVDGLAAEGLRVDECITSAPWTAPSVASILTGLYPQAHGVTAHRKAFLAHGVTTLAERAQADGVTTAAFTTNEYVSRRRNFDQGFETFVCAKYANARQVVREFEDWLVDHRDLQFFAYLHLFEPHDPCNAPGEDFDRYVDPELKGADSRAALARITGNVLAGKPTDPADPDVRLLRGRYLGEVRYFDRQLARLMRALADAKLEQRVVVVVTGDHGEEFGEHGLIGHGSQVYGESVRVPLVLWGPGHVAPGKTIAGPIENSSLCATVLDVMRVPYPSDELRPKLDLSGGTSGGGIAYTSTAQGILRLEPPDILTRPLHSVRSRDASLIYSPMGENSECAILRLFDLSVDPDERTNVRVAQPELLRKASDALRRVVALATKGLIGIDVVDEFGQVGYVHGTGADLSADEILPDGECYEEP